MKTQGSAAYSDVFKGCKKLQKVTVGKKFAFKHKTLRLPTQSSKMLSGATGKWYTKTGKGYASTKVPSKKAATYYAVAPISAAKISNVKKTVSYTGKKRTQNPVVKIGKTKLKKGKDYKITYKNNKKPGKATMIIKGVGNRVGTKKITFKIVR